MLKDPSHRTARTPTIAGTAKLATRTAENTLIPRTLIGMAFEMFGASANQRVRLTITTSANPAKPVRETSSVGPTAVKLTL